MKRFVCIDIGGTDIKHGVLDETAAVLEKGSRPTPAGGPAIVEAVLAIVEDLSHRHDVGGAAISSAGVVDCETGTVVYAGETMPGYMGTNLKAPVEDGFSLPCEVENDVNCAGLAEYISGAAKGSRTAVCLTVGTGIGGCAVVDGEVLHGVSGSAMEIGYLPLGEENFQDAGSARTLCLKVAAMKGDPPESWDGKRVFAGADAGDGACLAAIDEMCEVLGRGIAAICYVLNPDTVVLGGGVMARRDLLESRIDAALGRHLRPMVLKPLRLRFAAHGNDAGLIGALYHFQQLHKT